MESEARYLAGLPLDQAVGHREEDTAVAVVACTIGQFEQDSIVDHCSAGEIVLAVADEASAAERVVVFIRRSSGK